ncbi:Tify [Macleaya cordata]|uniref:Protein TIFY n=1 Tax=Macleaya cordata TaxID=56857 RepID=A0A200Q4K6_MACCD|nr:Tify [Macleaya cordata]
MTPGETILRSPLDKPLGQLTEDDISQLTRDDCRRYLKEKGMRRPSWNKSQAIEQVISLKSLLETPTESDTPDELRPNISVPRPSNPGQLSSNTVPSTEKVTTTATNTDFQVSVSANESVSFRRKDPPKPAVSGDVSCRPPVSDNNTTPPRSAHVTNVPASQMTIFYCGKVNVYDGMPADKARVIMQIAASPMHLLQDTISAGTSAVAPFPCRLQAASARPAITETSRQYGEEGTVSRDAEPEGPASRKASLQRYLEKRKDRGRFKIKKKIGGSSSSLEMYLNHQMRGQNPNEQSSHSGTCSPPQPRPPRTPARCNSFENQPNIIDLSFDLNDSDYVN